MEEKGKKKDKRKEIVVDLRMPLIVVLFGFGIGGLYISLKEIKYNYFLGFKDTYILEMVLLLINSLLLIYVTNKLLNISSKSD